MPYADPANRRRFEQGRAAKRRAAGLCATCNQLALPDKSRCMACHNKRRKT